MLGRGGQISGQPSTDLTCAPAPAGFFTAYMEATLGTVVPIGVPASVGEIR